MAEEQKAKYEIIYDMGTELYIAKVQLADLKEQDINARIMKNEMQDQLTANIKNRGQLESLPLIALMGEKLEIISGHHRVKSAREAGLKEIIVILDKSGLTRSKAASKQLAHNALSGFDDESTLREIVKLMDNVDDMMESYIGKEILEEPLEQFDKLNTPAVQFDFKTMLEKSGKLGTDVGSGEVDYIAPYAAMQYYQTADTRPYDANRGAHWFERMKVAEKEDILRGADKI